MAGEIFWKEAASTFTLEASGGTASNNSAIQADDADLNIRSGGLTNAVQNMDFAFELVAQWATVTGIGANTAAAELYLVPSIDGTNFPDVDTTSGSSNIPINALRGVFVCTRQPTANTNMRFVLDGVSLRPWLYRAYILNRSGQTISSGWALRGVSARMQFS